MSLEQMTLLPRSISVYVHRMQDDVDVASL